MLPKAIFAQTVLCLAGLAVAGCPGTNGAATHADLQAHLPTGLPFVQERKNAEVRRMLMDLMCDAAKSEVGDRDLQWAGMVRPLDDSSPACIVALFQKLIGVAGSDDPRLLWAPADDFRNPQIARVLTDSGKSSILSVVSITDENDVVRFEIGPIGPEFVVDFAFTADAPLIVNARRCSDGAFTIREETPGPAIMDVTLLSRPPIRLREIEDWRRLALSVWLNLDSESLLYRALHRVRRALESPEAYTATSVHGEDRALSPQEHCLFLLYMSRDVVRLSDEALAAVLEACHTKRQDAIATLRDAGVTTDRLHHLPSRPIEQEPHTDEPPSAP